MQRIFRGKQIDTGEWVFGSYIDFDLLHQIIPLGKSKAVAVFVDSVSQSTGRKDKNGVDEYGGDVVKLKLYKGDGHPERICEIVWATHCGCCGWSYFNEKTGYHHGITLPDGHEVEIIGNVTDSPELLKSA